MSQLEAARALTSSGHLGQRVDSLRKLRKAATAGNEVAVRNAVIAALARPDLELVERWSTPGISTTFGPGRRRLARVRDRRTIEIVSDAAGGAAAKPVVLPAIDADVRALRGGPAGRWLGATYRAARSTIAVLWDVPARRERFRTKVPDVGNPFAFRRDGTAVAIAQADATIVVLRLPDAEPTATLDAQARAHELAFSRDDRRLAVAPSSDSLKVSVWDVESGRRLAALQHSQLVNSLDWDAHDELLACGINDGRLHVWQVATGHHVELDAHRQAVGAVRFHPRRSLLATSGSDGRLVLWNPGTGRRLVETTGQVDGFTADGRELTFVEGTHGGGRLRVVPEHELELLHAPSDPGRGPDQLAVSPDGRWLTAACAFRGARVFAAGAARRNDAVVWEVASGEELARVKASATSVSFSPDGRWFVAGTGQGYLFHELPSFRLRHTVARAGAGESRGAIAWTADARCIALAEGRRNLVLCDPQTGRLLARLAAPPAAVPLSCVTFTRAGDRLAAGALGGHIATWDLAAIREQLATFDLDWDATPRPRVRRPPAAALEVDLGDLADIAPVRWRVTWARLLADIDRVTDRLHVHPDRSDLLLERARLSAAADLSQDALLDLERVTASTGETADLLRMRGRLELRLGRHSEARADLARCTELAPGRPDALVDLAWAWMDGPEPDFARALTLARRAAAVSAARPAIEVEAAALDLLGREDEARELLERHVARLLETPLDTSPFRLAKLLAATRRAEAEDFLRRATQLRYRPDLDALRRARAFDERSRARLRLRRKR